MNKYTKVKKIGEGSFGTALLVRSKENGKQMVVKEINMSKMGQKERVEARKETSVLAQLNHPNIVTYRESFEELGNLYIVMDYCDGGDLYSRINQCRGMLMAEDMVLDWFVQICLSIKHIHDRKILHRDIKSQNIFLTKHGIVKLGDFGISKVLNSTVELARTCIGTPYYLSPEIVENKPYNNKSDIWSLGCVLYEMTTLKHAFEAGNMKNLVLKIIRGSYPPVPPKYSYEIRNLIALLFKRNARDRPSINAVLRKPLLQNRIKKFLTENEYCDEFSHTIMHGQKIQKVLPVGQKRPSSSRPTPIAAKRPPSNPKYNPASVYAPSVARKSRELPSKVQRSSESRRSSDCGVARKSAEAKRPNAGVNSAQNELAKKKQELLQKEKSRQAAAREREQQYAKHHKELQEKQKMVRMRKAREEGWKGLLGSDESLPNNRKPSPKRDEPRRISPNQIPAFKPLVQPAAPRDRIGQYEHYHAYLDKLEQDRKAAGIYKPTPIEPPGAHGNGAPVGVAAALGGGAPQYMGVEAAQAAFNAQVAAAKGAEAAKRAKILEEYLARKREAASNKGRGVSEVHGAPSARPNAVAERVNGPISAREAHRKLQEDEYMSRLKQIRLHNFNERRMQNVNEQAAPAHKPPSGPEVNNHQDIRRKKIEALRAQADDRARRLKAELERKRREAYELEQHRLQMLKAKVPPAIPMTDAMKAIGAAPMTPPVVLSPDRPPIGLTAALDAIGAGQEPDKEKGAFMSPLQKKKEEILKRLNSKPKVAKATKWGKPVEPISERPKWCEAGDSGDLSLMQLEETGSHMEATNVNDSVTKFNVASPSSSPLPSPKPSPQPSAVPKEEDPDVSVRRQWGGRAGTVLNMMQGAELTDVSDGQSPNARRGSYPVSPCPVTQTPPEIIPRINKGTRILTHASLPELHKVEVDALPVSCSAGQANPDSSSKLFDKVLFDDEDEEAQRVQDDVVIEDLDNEVSSKIVKAGLQTGQFDVGDVKMLRTCSEPDLSKLFKTNMIDNPFFNDVKEPVYSNIEGPSSEENEQDIEENNDLNEEVKKLTDKIHENAVEDREADDEDDSSPIDDDDDIATVRESMMSFLEGSDDDEETEKTLTPASPKRSLVKKLKKKSKSMFKRKKGRSVKDVEASGAGDTPTNLERSESTEDFVTMRETMRHLLISSAVKTPKKMKKPETVPENPKRESPTDTKEESDLTTSGNGSAHDSWQSDDENEDFGDEDEDMFSRLEEKRAHLEQDLGCDKFLKAYRTVQAMHEEEDENMEEGIDLVSKILGDDKAHLYPTILQLVMADGAFMEDND